MFIKDLGYGAYAIHIDDPSLYDRFVEICNSYGYNWISGDALQSWTLMTSIPKIQTGNVMLYTPRSLAGAKEVTLPSHNIFTVGEYERYYMHKEAHKSRKFVRLSEMDDFTGNVNAVDISNCVNDLISQFV